MNVLDDRLIKRLIVKEEYPMSSPCSPHSPTTNPILRSALRSFALAALWVGFLLPTSASASDLKVANAWVSIPASYENPSAYFLIQNRDSKVRTIIGGRCEGCNWIEIRRVVFKDGVMGSEKMEAMEIPAGGAVAFIPRGLFISLIGLGSIERGARLPIELEFKNGERLEIEATVGQP